MARMETPTGKEALETRIEKPAQYYLFLAVLTLLARRGGFDAKLYDIQTSDMPSKDQLLAALQATKSVIEKILGPQDYNRRTLKPERSKATKKLLDYFEANVLVQSPPTRDDRHRISQFVSAYYDPMPLGETAKDPKRLYNITVEYYLEKT